MNPQDFAGTPMYGSVPPGMYPSQPPMQQGYDPNNMGHASTMMAPPGQPLAMGALGAQPEEKKKISPIPIVAVVLAGAVLGGVFLFGNKQPPPAAQQSEPPPAVTPPPPPAPPPATVAPQVVTTTSAAPPALKPFDATAAKAAIDAVASDLAACKVPKGKTCKVTVTFAPEGSVKTAKVEAPCSANQTLAKCVSGAVKKAAVAPFTGAGAPVSYSVLPPKK
jgi:hypothetical protein